jgi:hypothetical protein
MKALVAVGISMSQRYSKAVPEEGTAKVWNSRKETILNEVEDPLIPCGLIGQTVSLEERVRNIDTQNSSVFESSEVVTILPFANTTVAD